MMQPAATTSAPQSFGRFEVQGILGRGGMGTVYKAVDPVIGRVVAIKEIRIEQVLEEAEQEELKARYELEFRTAGALSHPNIVTIFDVGQSGHSYFIAMEYVAGMTLGERLRSAGQMPFSAIAHMAEQLADALDYAHGHDIVHRDIKPANVLLDGDDRPKISDFGLVKMLASELTRAGTVLGTPAYMSPEQVLGRDLDGCSDQFSLAVVFYLMLTGELPFTGERHSDTLLKIVQEPARPPREINTTLPEAVDGVFERALAKGPGDRFGNCRDLAHELRRALLDRRVGATRRPKQRTPSPIDPAAATTVNLPAPGAQAEPASGPDEVTLAGHSERTPIGTDLVKLDDEPTAPDRRLHSGQRSTLRTGWIAGGLVALLAVAAGAAFFAKQASRTSASATRTDAVATLRDAEVAAETPADETAAGAAEPAGAGPAPGASGGGTPAVAPPPPPPPASIAVVSSPSGARVFVGGRDSGQRTPATLRLERGADHRIELRLDGHHRASRTLRAADLAGKPRVELQLTAIQPPGTLVIDNAPYPVTVIVDGKQYGPDTRFAIEVPPGEYRVELVAEDVFFLQDRTVPIESGARFPLHVPRAFPVDISAHPSNCKISIDGRYVDVTPINNLPLAAGTHEIRFEWPKLGKTKTFHATIPGTRRIFQRPDD